jgi:hypothetical protein
VHCSWYATAQICISILYIDVVSFMCKYKHTHTHTHTHTHSHTHSHTHTHTCTHSHAHTPTVTVLPLGVGLPSSWRLVVPFAMPSLLGRMEPGQSTTLIPVEVRTCTCILYVRINVFRSSHDFMVDLKSTFNNNIYVTCYEKRDHLEKTVTVVHKNLILSRQCLICLLYQCSSEYAYISA